MNQTLCAHYGTLKQAEQTPETRHSLQVLERTAGFQHLKLVQQPDGTWETLPMTEQEQATFWLSILTEIGDRLVQVLHSAFPVVAEELSPLSQERTTLDAAYQLIDIGLDVLQRREDFQRRYEDLQAKVSELLYASRSLNETSL